MTRTQLFELAEKHGLRGKGKLTHEEKAKRRAAMKAELVAYFKSPEGRAALERAPRVNITDEDGRSLSSDFPLQDQALERLADLIMQEID